MWSLWFLRLGWSGSIGSIWIRVFWPESSTCQKEGIKWRGIPFIKNADRYNDPDDSWYLEFDIERIEEEYLEDFDANRIDAGDYPGNSINELERKADEAMYQNKSEYYARTGKDRRRR